MGTAQTEAFNHITSGTSPRAASSSGSSFVQKQKVDSQKNTPKGKQTEIPDK